MNKTPPLAALGALLVVGLSIELVESQNRQAAWALVVLILLGMITFNAAAFGAQAQTIIALLNAPSQPAQASAPQRTPSTATPVMR